MTLTPYTISFTYLPPGSQFEDGVRHGHFTILAASPSAALRAITFPPDITVLRWEINPPHPQTPHPSLPQE